MEQIVELRVDVLVRKNTISPPDITLTLVVTLYYTIENVHPPVRNIPLTDWTIP